MLKLMLGKDWTANTNAVLSAVKDNVNKNIYNQILLVPDLISHDMERRLCASVGDSASRFVEVLTFSRLFDRVLDQYGFSHYECLDDGGRMVAMASAVRQLHSRLKAYASLETRPEFLSDLVDMIDEFKCCCILPKDLTYAAENTQGVLSQKLEELSLIYDAYESICNRGKHDPRDRMTWLLEQLEDCDFAKFHTVFVDGFPDFTRQHSMILEHFITHSDNVTISLNCDKPASAKTAFEKAGSTAKEIIQFAKRHEIPYEIEYVSETADPLREFKENFLENRSERITNTEFVEAFQAESLRQECAVVLQKIRKLVMDGCRYRDISIVCADMPAYRDLLSMMFRKSGIPLYISGTDELLEKNAISTVLCMIDVALNGYETADVLRYLKSMLSPVSTEIADQLEQYAFIWSVKGALWYKQWDMHPRGLGEKWKDSDYEQLAILNKAREDALIPLEKFRTAFRKAANMAQQIEALYALFVEIDLENKFRLIANEMEQNGQLRNAQIFNQLWEILVCAMEQMHAILYETVWDPDTFSQLFKLLLSKYDVGTIPPVLDSVTVGSVSVMRCQEAKYLFVMGASDGKLPSYSGSTGILSDSDRSALRSIGISVNDNIVVGLQAEFAEIYGVFCGARERICVSYSSGQPSFVFKRVASLINHTADHNQLSAATVSNDVEAAAFLSRYTSADEATALGISDIYRDMESRRKHDLGSVKPERIPKLYGSILNLSASQVDRQAECRLSYFFRYGIRAKEWQVADINPAEFGTYVHAVLENTVKEIMDLGGFRNVSADEALVIARKYSDQYAQKQFSQIASERLTYLFNRNIAELDMIVTELWQEMHNSDFEPSQFELSFGDDGEMPAIQIDGAAIHAELSGYVDRVDLLKREDGQYFRVVDYKTGKKSIDYCDLFNGIGLQMLLYMFALEQNGAGVLGSESTPAGVLYFPARVPYESADNILTDEEASALRASIWKRKGLLLSDEEIISAMDPSDGFDRLCVSKKKDGTLSGDIANAKQMDFLKKYVFQWLRNMINEIASGNVKSNPYARGSNFDACKYCPYNMICYPESICERRNYKTVSAQKFWDDIEKEVNDDGGEIN